MGASNDVVPVLIYLAGANASVPCPPGAYTALADIDAQPAPQPETNPDPAPPELHSGCPLNPIS